MCIRPLVKPTDEELVNEPRSLKPRPALGVVLEQVEAFKESYMQLVDAITAKYPLKLEVAINLLQNLHHICTKVAESSFTASLLKKIEHLESKRKIFETEFIAAMNNGLKGHLSDEDPSDEEIA